MFKQFFLKMKTTNIH